MIPSAAHNERRSHSVQTHGKYSSRLYIPAPPPVLPVCLDTAAALTGTEEAAEQDLQLRIGVLDADALEIHACGAAGLVEGIGIVLLTKPIPPDHQISPGGTPSRVAELPVLRKMGPRLHEDDVRVAGCSSASAL